MSIIRIDLFYTAFGFKFVPQNFTKLEVLLWCCNVLFIISNYSIFLWFWRDFFPNVTIATYICDIIMWSSPQATHMLLLIEVWRKRKLIRKFWQLVQFESNQLQGYGHLIIQSDAKLRSVVLRVFVIYVLLGAFVDLASAYIYRDFDLYFYYWIGMMWSVIAVRIGMTQLFIALEIVNIRLDTIIHMLDAIVLQTRWRVLNKTGCHSQLQRIHTLYVRAWSMNDYINRIYDWILLAYTFYVFSFLTYNMFWVFKMVLIFEKIQKICESLVCLVF
jgi:7tm Chemosensory receptor